MQFPQISSLITPPLGQQPQWLPLGLPCRLAPGAACISRRLLSLLAAVLFGTHPVGAVSQEIATVPTAATSQQLSENAPQGYEFSFPAMGTQVELKAFHHNPAEVQQAFAEVQRRVAELAAILTDYDPDSETRQLSTRAQQNWVSVSDPLWQVLVASEHWQQLSQGAFDSSLGQLTQLWRKYRRAARQPSPEQLQWARQHSGWQYVELDREHQQVQFSCDDLRLDFGAIGKGYVVDQAFAVLEQHGLQRVLVNISGNMRAGEPPPGRGGWRIEIAPLERGGQPLRQMLVAHTALATSGDLWQFMVIDGIRRSHILDPRTGIGVAGPVCATVISPTATNADALATTACILGFDAAQQIASRLDNTELLWAKKISSQPTPADAAGSDSSTGQIVHIQNTAGFPPPL